MEPFKWILGYLKQYKVKYILALFMVLIAAALAMVNPYFAGRIADEVIKERKTELLMGMLLIMTIAILSKAFIRYTFQMIFENVSQNIFQKIRETIYIRIQQLDFAFFDKVRTGDLMAKMTGDMDAVRHFIAWVVYQCVENGAILIFSIIMLFTTNSILALITLLITPITGIITYKLAKELKPAFTEIRGQFSKLNTVVQENISGNRVVKAFAKEDYEIEKFEEQNEEFKVKNKNLASISERYFPILDMMGGVFTVVMILFGGIFVIKGIMTIGELVAFNSYIWALVNPMRMGGFLVNDIQRFSASAEKVIELMETYPQIQDMDENIKEVRLNGNVEFKNVSFSYGDEEVLEDISFTAKPGQRVAVVGPTGSGKSTLISLICRYYEAQSGEILLDNMDIRDLELKTLRSNVSVAMQDIFLFSDSIEGNIAYGMPEATQEQVEWAANAAGAHDFILGFTEGYDTIVGERGVGLSGGQKQRIALARTLLKNPSILVLDDTTSSLDIKTEQRIHKTLNTHFSEITTFIIAHRITSVKNADIILVLEKGRIIERGTHDQLLARKGYYYNVYINQFGDFDKDLQDRGTA